MKLCPKCTVSKPLADFYANKLRPDGRNSWCKECSVLDGRRYRALNRESIQAKDKARNLLDKRKAQRAAIKAKAKFHPEKAAAQNMVLTAIKNGYLTRPTTCSIPGCSEKKPDAHHPDYSKPLEVIWLCRTHHQQLHNPIREIY